MTSALLGLPGLSPILLWQIYDPILSVPFSFVFHFSAIQCPTPSSFFLAFSVLSLSSHLFSFECVYCTSTICEGVRERQDEDTMTDSESNQNYYSLRSFTSSLGDSDDIQKTGGVYFYPCWWVSLWLTSYALFFTRTSWPFLDFVLQEAFHKQAEVWSGESGRIRENIVFSSPA